MLNSAYATQHNGSPVLSFGILGFSSNEQVFFRPHYTHAIHYRVSQQHLVEMIDKQIFCGEPQPTGEENNHFPPDGSHLLMGAPSHLHNLPHQRLCEEGDADFRQS
jgi:hypothetical protein